VAAPSSAALADAPDGNIKLHRESAGVGGGRVDCKLVSNDGAAAAAVAAAATSAGGRALRRSASAATRQPTRRRPKSRGTRTESTGATALSDPCDASPPTVEIVGTNCIRPPPTFVAGCHFCWAIWGAYSASPKPSWRKYVGKGMVQTRGVEQ